MVSWLVVAACTSNDSKPGGPELWPPIQVTDLTYRLNDDVKSVVHVSWTQSQPATVRVEYSFDDGIWLSTPSVAYDPGTNERTVVGIPFATDAEWRVVVEGPERVFPAEPLRTGVLPDELPVPRVDVNDPAGQWPAEFLVTSINAYQGGWTGGKYWTLILDRQARVVWADRTPQEHWTLFAQVAVTGDHLLVDEQTYWSDFYSQGETSTVHRRYLDEQIEEIATPGLHHAFVQLPDETLVWGSQAHGGGEALVERKPGAATENVLWTCTDDWPGVGSCESNGIYYNPLTESFLYSFYTNSSVVEVDYGTGESLWWAGTVNGGYEFVPRESQYSWQHGLSYTDAGTLLLSSEWGQPTTTWLLEYEVDRTDGTLELVWSSDSGVRADTNGQAWRLDNGNTLHIVGSAGVIREVDAEGVDLWRVDFDGNHLLGAGEFLPDLYDLIKAP